MLLGQQPTVNFAFGLHNHQPYGNLDWVVADAYEKAYAPFLAVLERHPGIKVGLHYSGFLLEWLLAHHADLLGRLVKRVASGQVELLGGAYYEPILAIIPDDNKIEQIVHHRQAVHRLLGGAPDGMWLAERVWEPHLVKPIAEAGIRWTCLDDTHFKAAGLRGTELFGYYQSEEQGHYLEIFPINQEVCGLLPFATPEKAIDYLRQAATPDGSRLVVAFDSGEKFGVWPGTHRSVYEAGWLDAFFTLLEENADWIHSTTIAEYRARFRPWGRLYLPAGTYREMEEWSLPAEQHAEFDGALTAVGSSQRQYVRGGYWRNFLVKYPEANNLHKKMLSVASQVASAMTTRQVLVPVPAGDAAEPGAFPDDWVSALHNLWKGQSNDPYWHGVFGGLYLAHLRSANYAALIKAEAICDRLQHGTGAFLEAVELDFDGDGSTEILLRNHLVNAYFSRKGGALFELDYKPRTCNLLDTLARRPEAYHGKLSQAVPADHAANRGAVRSIHELVLTKEEGLEKYLHYDWYRRVSLLDHFLHPDSHLESFYNVSYGEQGDFVIESYDAETAEEADRVVVTLKRDGHVWVGQEFWPVRVTKRVSLLRDEAVLRADYEVRNGWDRPVTLWFGVEFNASFQAGNAPDRFYTSPEGEISERHMGSKGQLANLTVLGMRDMTRNLEYQLRWQHAATVWRFPIETISQSEAGFERVYQGSAVMPHWRIDLPPGGTWKMWIEQRIAEI
jgi:alpha-amylase